MKTKQAKIKNPVGRPASFTMKGFVSCVEELTSTEGPLTVAQIAGELESDKTTIANYIKRARAGRHVKLKVTSVRQGERGPKAKAYEVI